MAKFVIVIICALCCTFDRTISAPIIKASGQLVNIPYKIVWYYYCLATVLLKIHSTLKWLVRKPGLILPNITQALKQNVYVFTTLFRVKRWRVFPRRYSDPLMQCWQYVFKRRIWKPSFLSGVSGADYPFHKFQKQ